MDVNKANAVTPVGQGGPKQEHRRGSDDDKPNPDDASGDQAAGDSPWDGTEAYAMDGILAGSLSPEARDAFASLAAELEPLRAELERTRGREAHYKELAEKHSFLPVPGRREFLRELNHVVAHMANLTPRPALVVLHLVNGDDIRRRYGRGALDGALARVCEALDAALHPTDVVGSLGGNDFGIILLIGDADLLATKMENFVEAVSGARYSWNGAETPLQAVAGMAVLADGVTAENALAAADRDMVDRLSAPGSIASGDDIG